ncbi:MAG TPA: hypothetical protein VF940_22185 [Streptosporangiaceae bacterium]
MPGADTVWLIELAKLTGVLREAGLTVIADSPQIADQIGTQAIAELITAHQLWNDWLGSGRVRKFAMVAQTQ